MLWSDIPNNRILRWDEVTGSVSDFRSPSNMANGNARDRQGRLITAEHLGRQVTCTQYDGSITVLMDRWQGKRLNSPYDVSVKSDGSIWFTDPPFGLRSYYEEAVAAQELPTHVYRIGPDGVASVVIPNALNDDSSFKAFGIARGAGGAAARQKRRLYQGSFSMTLGISDEIAGANGLCFSPDETILYIVDSSAAPHRSIRAFDVIDAKDLKNHRVFVDAGVDGTPDGIRCDIDGNLWCGWGMGMPALDGAHALIALFHHFIWRDGVLQRMLPAGWALHSK